MKINTKIAAEFTLNFLKRNKKGFLLLFLSLVASFYILEFALEKLNYPYTGCKEMGETEETAFGHFDQDTGWSYNSMVTYYREGSKYSFNKYGFRTDDPLRDIDYSKPRILFIGDSITFGYGLNYEETFAAKIGKLLGDKFEVVNIGVEGFATDQTLHRLRDSMEVVKPSIVVYTFIPDHINRNINSDRQELFKCFPYWGTKPVFTKTNNKDMYGLKQIRFPEPIEEKYKNKVALVLNNFFDRIRESDWKKRGLDVEIAKSLIKEIESENNWSKASTYYIVYDNIYDPSPNSYNQSLVQKLFLDQNLKVLPFFDFAKDPKGDYYVSVSHFHPNGKVTSMLAEEFNKKFGQEILDSLNKKN
jgi:hypothetical protein